jgi:RND family efflux transporter MFP subunit
MRRGLIMILVLALMIPIGCGKKQNNNTLEPERVAVETAVADYGMLTVSKSYSGTIEGLEHAELTAKLGETVEQIKVRQGDKVRVGQLLLTLDEGGPSSQYRQAEALYMNAKKLLEKYENLYREGAVSENQMDGIRTEFEIAKANFKAAGELVNIIAPINGEVTALNVNAGDQAFPGQNLATVSRTDSIRIKIGLDPEEIGFVHQGDTVAISMQGANGLKLTGIISKVAISANPETRAFSVEIIAANHDNVLKVGGFATVDVKLYTLEDVLLIPKQAVLIQKGIPKLFRLQSDTARSVEVQMGLDDGISLQIISGINAGDEIVVLGQAFLSDGSLVNVVKSEGVEE